MTAYDTLIAKVSKSPFFSKKLWVTLIGLAGIVIPAVAAGGVNTAVIAGIVPTVVAYVLGQAHVDAATTKALADVASAGASMVTK